VTPPFSLPPRFPAQMPKFFPFLLTGARQMDYNTRKRANNAMFPDKMAGEAINDCA